MTEHIVRAYDEELQQLSRHIAQMGGIAEIMIVDAIQALLRVDLDLAHRIIAKDKSLDLLQRQVEDDAIRTIAKRQPMGSDLRVVVSSLRISNDLERCGDLAKNIAKRVIAVRDQFQPPKLVHGIEHMAELAQRQLTNVLNAYVSGDVEQAIEVWKSDDEIDAIYTSIFRELLTYMMEDPRNITFCTHLLFCAKNVERIGDHATNIAETVVFQVTGNQIEEERPKGADISTTAFEPNI
ncbi:MAG: phosphate transport system regulatory protein PhoU [Hyphomicrobiales bacterium]|nr:phosphate signaling complex protein PhoU [Hyphomicrobiales bacterium]PCJ94637.1 MAG: phosphate transport system regulatory protein PhoU [Hyphomicrobiales bacterium]